MAAPVPIITLNNGVNMPAIGLGCWAGFTTEERTAAKDWILTALQSGYRHLDTGFLYGTEASVGAAIREFGIPQEQIFVTTKLPWHHTDQVKESIEESLANAKLDYYDLTIARGRKRTTVQLRLPLPLKLIVAITADGGPLKNPDGSYVLASGKVRAIGVSNFSIKNIEKLLTTAKVIPAINQVELHPYLAQPELLEYCKTKGIYLAAYAPSGYTTVRDDPVIKELAAKYCATPTQIILAWHIARGYIAVPKSQDPQRQKENVTLITLSPEDVKRVSGLNRGQRQCCKADEGGKVFGWSMEQLGW